MKLRNSLFRQNYQMYSIGLEWEGDQRHVQSILDKVGLSKGGGTGGRGGKGVDTPGVKHEEDEHLRKPMGIRRRPSTRD